MRRNEEEQIHRAIVSHLRLHGAPGLVFFHPANGGYRSPVEAAILKGLGVRPGVSDLILLHNSRFYALELKVDKGRVTPSQKQFADDVRTAGGSAEISYGLDEALKVLESWKLLRGKVQ